jgi:hypothetical protein
LIKERTISAPLSSHISREDQELAYKFKLFQELIDIFNSKQEKFQGLTEERNKLETRVNMYKSLFKTLQDNSNQRKKIPTKKPRAASL